MPRPRTLTPAVLNAAIVGLEAQRERIEARIAEVRAMLDGRSGNSAATPGVPARKRRRFNAATRRKMAESQKLRWAKIRGEAEPSAPVKPKIKRRISAEGLKRIIAATKKRWRLQKAALAKAKSATAKPARGRKKASVSKAA
jgi:hypothetical protein